MKYIILILTFLFSNYSVAEYKITFNKSNIKIPEQSGKSPEGFWTYKGFDVRGLYPTYTDASSSGIGMGDFNFGQRLFLGDPKGFSAYDINYDPSLWENGTLYNGNYITPLSVRSAQYIKNHNSGKYYFEVTIGGSSHADIVGFGKRYLPGEYSQQLNRQEKIIGIGSIGTAYNSKPIIFQNENIENFVWADNLSIIPGDTIQIWVDYDNNGILFKKLGSKKEDYNIQEF